ncbi:OsmC family protein [Bdellovibrio svalbardensis]|uniref:OsmC family protein n=1 Tax=Bdellovibrio svalbardensis TaxID=2972972 RepID=A0ABT6DHT5_9BACT|nr:OsmC family protein [Bdellovibrio svalbardensis]MDG0816387.1 OsmC family protein [Bdellovibrio svalbardensis]
MAQKTSHITCQTKWAGGMAFEAHFGDHKFTMDSKSDFGGKDLGPSPKEVLLSSICACSGMDVASILQKMRVDLQSCDINAQTETTEGYPSIFKQVRVQYHVASSNAKEEQVMKAVVLSMTKYCGVTAMVAPTSPVVYEVFLNAEKIGEGIADFTAAKQD